MAAIGSIAAQVVAHETEPTFRAGVALVKVDAQVVDGRGHNITDLSQADFEILDEDRPQRITGFAHESEPIDLLLLLDVSGSMRRSLGQLAATAESALAELHSADRVAVMLFARDAAMRTRFTSDFGRVAAGIRSGLSDEGLGGGTAINSALVSATLQFADAERRGRRAVLIVTDNMSLNYRVSDDEVLHRLSDANAVLYGMLIGKSRRPPAPRPGTYVNPDFTPSDIAKLAELSGGEFAEASRPSETLADMVQRIRARYSLEFEAPPSAASAYHRIRVELAPGARERYPNARVRARNGYFAAQ